MTDVDEFIDGVLEHKYDPVKAREYYLRTRKLKGRLTRRVKNEFEEFTNPTKAANRKVREVGREMQTGRDARAERLEQQELKIRSARARLKNASPEKRKKAEIKLNALEKKLNQARRGVRNARKNVESIGKIRVKAPKFENPFKGARITRSR